MELKLFSREYIHSDLSYEENLKLRPLLEKFFSKENAAFLLEMFSLYGDSEEIAGRQAFFREITENENSREFLKKIRAFYRPVENAVILYQKAEGHPDKDIWGLNVLKQYTGFVKAVAEEKPCLYSDLSKKLYETVERIRLSPDFRKLCDNLEAVETEFAAVREMNVYGNYVSTVLFYYGIAPGKKKNIRDTIDGYLSDMGFEVERKEIFQTGDIDVYKKYSSYIVSKYPELAALLCKINGDFTHEIQHIAAMDIKDVKIALACCELYDLLKEKGVSLCYPRLSQKDEVVLEGMCDISLLTQKDNIISNSVNLAPGDKTAFVSGANGGGKTSFVRAVGICNVMCSCGLFVPAVSAVLSVRDNIFTVFPHNEQLSMEGRFVTEKGFLEAAVRKATNNSLILANELFSTTDENTALGQYEYFTGVIENKGARALYVTHFTNVVSFFGDSGYPLYSCKMQGEQVTFTVERTGEHSSSVVQLLKKYGLQQSQLKERLSDNA